MPYELITRLLDFPDFRLVDIETEERSVVLTLEREKMTFRCGSCGKEGLPGYDHKIQEVRHLLWWQHPTVIRFPHYRVSCPTCKVVTEEVEFLPVRGPRVTRPLAHLVYELCKITTHKAVSLLLGLHRGTVKAIDQAMMEKVQSERPLDGIDILGFDEIAAGKGQSYWTLICAPEGPRGPELLHIVEGRKEKDLTPFWSWFGKERAQKVTHAVMDMWPAFRKSFLAHCPKGKVIYDKFHVIRHLLEAVNEVRKQELKRLGGAFKGLLSGKKFVLLARRSNLKPEAKKALSELLLVSPRLLKAYVLKESFDHLWDFTSRTWAMKFFRKWVGALKWSRLTPLKKFAAMVEEHLDGILSSCDRKVPLGYVESTNQKAKNVIRRAYGYRDKDFKRLKIIQACTPWMNEFQPWSRYP
jgi:Transposase and inactivated derivatives